MEDIIMGTSSEIPADPTALSGPGPMGPAGPMVPAPTPEQKPQVVEMVPALTSEQALTTVVQGTQVTPEISQQITTLRKQLNRRDPNSLIVFASAEQGKLDELSQEAIQEAKSKDLGPVGEAMVDMSTKMRGLDMNQLVAGGHKPGFFSRMIGKVEPVVRFMEQYENVGTQLELAKSKLTGSKLDLMKSQERLILRYEATLDYYHNLGLYILALKEERDNVENNELPALRSKARSVGADLMLSQDVTDLESYRDDVSRKITDLLLSRQLAQQRIVATRITQNNNTALINKIQNQITNVLPSWRDQIALAIEMAKTADAAMTTKIVDDTTDEIILNGAKLLRQGTALVQAQINRPMTSLEVATKANEELMGTIDDIQAFVKAGEANRRLIEVGIAANEEKLKQKLLTHATNPAIMAPKKVMI
jgi:uncharacterized protein YaaN involved in tellurite resistance